MLGSIIVGRGDRAGSGRQIGHRWASESVGGVGCGRPGSIGTTGSDGAESGPAPALFAAETVKVTGASFVSP